MSVAGGSSRPHPDSTIHATCVAVRGRAVLIRGASGSGKSSLALQLIALGAGLVADDRTCLWRAGGTLLADAPDTIRGRIEARNVGILTVAAVGPSPVCLVVDLDREESDRLPQDRRSQLLGVDLPCLGKANLPHFPAAILLYLDQNE